MKISSNLIAETSKASPDGIYSSAHQAIQSANQNHKWGPAVINHVASKAANTFAPTLANISAAWRPVLDRLIKSPGALETTRQSFLDSMQSFNKTLSQAMKSSNATPDKNMKRQQIVQRIKQIKASLDSAVGMGKAGNKAQIKSLVSELRQLASALQATNVGAGSIGSLPNFDGVSGALKGLVPTGDSASSTHTDLNSQTDDSALSKVTDLGESNPPVDPAGTANQPGSTSSTAAPELKDLIEFVYQMQEATNSQNDNKTLSAQAEIEVDKNVREVLGVVQNLIAKGERMISTSASENNPTKSHTTSRNAHSLIV